MSRYQVEIKKTVKLPPARSRQRGQGQRHFIYRHFENSDLDNIYAGTVDYGVFDAFSAKPEPATNAYTAMQSLIAQGIRGHYYYNTNDYGLNAWTGYWFDYWQGTVRDSWAARYVNGSSEVGLFLYFCQSSPTEYRDMVAWDVINTQTRLQSVADRMFNVMPNIGLFLDQSWAQPPSDFFCDWPASGPCGVCVNDRGEHGAPYSDFTSRYPNHEIQIRQFWALVEVMANARGNWTIRNGDTTAGVLPRPIYYENSGLAGDLNPAAVAGWKEHPRNVLSIDVPPYPYPLGGSFEALKREFRDNGGWVAVTTVAASPYPVEGADGPNVQEAYRQLAQIRGAG